MESLTIGEVARRVGLRTSAVRYYESVGLIPEAARVSGQRRYDSSILNRLAVIRAAQEAGFTIAEIQTLLHDFPEEAPPSQRWQRLATHKIAEIEAQIQRMQAIKQMLEMLLDCQCRSLDICGQELADSIFQSAGQ
jgi:MerR family redox-sensitive transcriptional activator SoxR